MKTRIYFLSMLAVVFTLAILSGGAFAAPGKSKAAERSKNTFDREAAMQQRAEVHAWLNSEAVSQGWNSPINVAVSRGEMLDIDMARGEVPERVGLTKVTSRDFAFGDVNLKVLKGKALARTHGALQETSDGGYVFTAALASPEATAIRVHFKGFRLPEKAGLYLYTESGQVFGPYTGRGPLGDGDFWSHTVMGEEVSIQLRHFGTPSDDDLRNTSFNVAGVAHVRPRYLGGTCSFNAGCVENADCTELSPDLVPLRKAIAHMNWISGPYIYMCTGGLVADMDTGSDIPYFLTANHCISRSKDARNLETFFQLQKSCGLTSCADIYTVRDSHPTELRTLGATIKATGKNSDFTLFELNGIAPPGSSFLGWDESPVATTDGYHLFRISHPGGAPQSYSTHDVDPNAPQCRSWPRGDRIYSRDIIGATEGGSSGSPVVNSSGQIVGQLSGACGTNVSDTCDAVNNATVDGAFAAYFSDIEQFLDPDTGGGGCESAPEQCTDGVDNDCDGLIDFGDPDDCPPLPAGASCSANNQCLSGRCKGRGGNKTCK